MLIHFHVSRRVWPTDVFDEQRYLTWVGEVDWPSLPHEGTTCWCHCSGWAVETITRVYFNGPYIKGSVEDRLKKAPITIEVKTNEEVMNHLVGHHNFEDTRY